MKRHPCKGRDLLLRRLFTGARAWLRSKFWDWRPTKLAAALCRSTGILIFYSTGVLSASAGDPPRYRFEEGEPLAYKMEVGVTNETLADAHFYDQSDKSEHKES